MKDMERRKDVSMGGSGEMPSLLSSKKQRPGMPVPKATPFALKKESLQEKQRLMELHQQLDENNQQILLQKLEIRSLKDQIIKLLEEKNILGPGSAIPESREGRMSAQRESKQSSGYLPQLAGKD